MPYQTFTVLSNFCHVVNVCYLLFTLSILCHILNFCYLLFALSIHHIYMYPRSTTYKTLSLLSTRSCSPNSFVDPNLQPCSHAFVRCDRVKSPLQPPSNGPFEVLHRGEKTFSLQMNGRVEIVSVDRLKAASLKSSPTSSPLPPQRPPLPPSSSV